MQWCGLLINWVLKHCESPWKGKLGSLQTWFSETPHFDGFVMQDLLYLMYQGQPGWLFSGLGNKWLLASLFCMGYHLFSKVCFDSLWFERCTVQWYQIMPTLQCFLYRSKPFYHIKRLGKPYCTIFLKTLLTPLSHMIFHTLTDDSDYW